MTDMDGSGSALRHFERKLPSGSKVYDCRVEYKVDMRRIYSVDLPSLSISLKPIDVSLRQPLREPLSSEEMRCFEGALDRSHPFVDFGFLLE